MIETTLFQKKWDEFLIENNGSFLQSVSWGDFKKKYQKIYRFKIEEEGRIIALCQAFEEKSPFGKYFYVPYGPVAKDSESNEKVVKKITERAREEGAYFVKIESVRPINIGFKSFFRVQPQNTIISDISAESEEIMKNFSRTARYNIRYAKKNNVVVEKSNDLGSFINLLSKTTERQGFYSYSEEYFKKLLQLENTALFLAFHKEDVVAGAILLYFNKTVYFLHAASDHAKRNLKAPGLIRYETIKHAKENNCTLYDFWGIDEKRFPGVTEYKRSFGGEEVNYPTGIDIIIKKIPYYAHKIALKIKRKK